MKPQYVELSVETRIQIRNMWQFLETLEENRVPKRFPYEAARLLAVQHYFSCVHRTVPIFKVRDRYMMHGIVDMDWTCHLANHLNRMKVLEVMAGAGWLARALQMHGMKVMSTDLCRWRSSPDISPNLDLYPIEIMDAIKAIQTYEPKADVLIMSFPPWDSLIDLQAAEAWGSKRPIVVIREGTGCDAILDHFARQEAYDIPTWSGIHDAVYIGHYTPDTTQANFTFHIGDYVHWFEDLTVSKEVLHA